MRRPLGRRQLTDRVAAAENYEGAYQAVTYLIDHGHRHSDIVGSWPRAYLSIRERRRRYLEALQGHEVAKTYFADCHLRREEALAATTQLLAKNPQVTALFGANDEMAIAAMRAVQTLGRHVPPGCIDLRLRRHRSSAPDNSGADDHAD